MAVAASRVLLDYHWLSDVVGGLALGWGWFALCAVIFGGRLLRPTAAVDVATAAATATTPTVAEQPCAIARPGSLSRRARRELAETEPPMPELLIDFITSLDGYGAAEGWPGWWGLEGPEYLAWLGDQPEAGYTILMGANTYRLMSGFAAAGEPGTDVLAGMSKIVFSSTLTRAADVAEHAAGRPGRRRGRARDEGRRHRVDAHARQPRAVPLVARTPVSSIASASSCSR